MYILTATRREPGRISSNPPFFTPDPLLVHIKTLDFSPRWNSTLDSLMHNSRTRRAWLLFLLLVSSPSFCFLCATVRLLLFRCVDLVLVLGGLSMFGDLLYMITLQYISCWRSYLILVLLDFSLFLVGPLGRDPCFSTGSPEWDPGWA